MYNKDSLKMEHRMFAVLVTLALGLSTVAGCGAKESVSSGTVESTAADTGTVANEAKTGAETGTVVAETATKTVSDAATEADAGTDAEKADAEDLPALAYKTAEERQHQEKPEVIDGNNIRDIGYTANMFFEVTYAGFLHGDTEFTEEELAEANEMLASNPTLEEANSFWDKWDDVHRRVEGTLYKVYFYGEPDNDFVYFPGDELPEGYTVEKVENFVLDTDDTDPGYPFVPQKDLWGNLVYERSDYEAGQYGELLYHVGGDGLNEWYKFVQYLTKEDLEKLPEDTNLDGIAHY